MGRKFISILILGIILLIGSASVALAMEQEHPTFSHHECCDFSQATPTEGLASSLSHSLFYQNLILAAILLVSVPVLHQIISKPPPVPDPLRKFHRGILKRE